MHSCQFGTQKEAV